jgi:hypothetical protein
VLDLSSFARGGETPHRLLIAGTTAAFLFAVPAAPASAAPPVVDLNCTITATSDVYPGEIYGVPRHLAATTHGLTGTADCTGTVDGESVTGQGQFGVTSQEEGDCGATQTIGQNEFVLRIPTTGGVKTVAGIYADTTVRTPEGVRNVLSGDITGRSHFISSVGDCVNEPLTQVTYDIVGHVT